MLLEEGEGGCETAYFAEDGDGHVVKGTPVGSE